MKRVIGIVVVALAQLLPACATGPRAGRDGPARTAPAPRMSAPETMGAGHWVPRTVWRGDAKVQRVAIGDVDPTMPGNEAIGVDYAGRVVLVGSDPAENSGKEIYSTGSKLTGLLIADIDPAVPGNEVYIGGYSRGEEGGAAIQLVVRAGKVTARRIYEGDGFIHSFARHASPTGGDPELVITTYTGKVLVATPGPGDGLWSAREIHAEPSEVGEEGMKIKDVLSGAIGGTPGQVFIATKSGRGVLIDPAKPGAGDLIHEEPGGIARAALGGDGSIWLGANDGRIVHLISRREEWQPVVVYHDTDVNHGIVLGRFPTGCGRIAPVAVDGYTGFCRLLLPAPGGKAWDSVTIFEDEDMAHWLAAGDLVPGNDADELITAGYTNNIVVLVWVPGR